MYFKLQVHADCILLCYLVRTVGLCGLCGGPRTVLGKNPEGSSIFFSWYKVSQWAAAQSPVLGLKSSATRSVLFRFWEHHSVGKHFTKDLSSFPMVLPSNYQCFSSTLWKQSSLWRSQSNRYASRSSAVLLWKIRCSEPKKFYFKNL